MRPRKRRPDPQGTADRGESGDRAGAGRLRRVSRCGSDGNAGAVAAVSDVAYALAHRAQRKAGRRRRRELAMAAQPAAVSATQQQGELAQALARAHLEAAGLVCLAHNLRARTGELDLVMRDGDQLVFVEVRERRGASHGGAAASVGWDKRRRLVRTAQVFLQTWWRGPVPACRFDVVALDGGALQWVRGAFDETGSV